MIGFPEWPTAFDIPADKLTRYLLDVNGRKPDHARWFIAQGFDPAEPALLASVLYRHARRDNLMKVAEDTFGLRFVFEAPLDVSFARPTMVRSDWMCQRGDALGAARLVTAYPVARLQSEG